MGIRAVLITPTAVTQVQIPSNAHAIPTLHRLIGSEMDSAWVSNTTQILFAEANGATAFFHLPGSPKLAKAVVIDYFDGEYRDVSWTVAEVRARVRWGTQAQTKPPLKPKRARGRGCRGGSSPP